MLWITGETEFIIPENGFDAFQQNTLPETLSGYKIFDMHTVISFWDFNCNVTR